ncbi:MAG: glutamate racemase [Patescibacteria group bacterium]
MIGIFDSGYGGLTIFKEIEKLLPEYDYVYLGDSARAPYGGRSKEAVTRFSREAVDFLFKKGCSLIVFACYSASAMALREIQQKYLPTLRSDSDDKKRNVLGVIRPVVEYAATRSKKQKIGVVGTRGTIMSGAFEVELKERNPKLRVVSRACPLLVPLIEEHKHRTPEARAILHEYVAPLKKAGVDTLILGCTHYPHMLTDFQREMGKGVEIFNPGKIVAKSLKNYLTRHPELEPEMAKKTSKKQNGSCTFFTTDDIVRFKEFGEKFAGIKIGNVKKINL